MNDLSPKKFLSYEEDEKLKTDVKNLLLLLSDEQKEKDIIEVNNIDEEVYSFLEENPPIDIPYTPIGYKTPSDSDYSYKIQEKEGNIVLWDKNGDVWSILMYHIKKLKEDLGLTNL